MGEGLGWLALALLAMVVAALGIARARREAAARAALARRLAQAERLAVVGELAATIAHEIKNPLAPVRGYAQMLEARLDRVDPEERELFARALRVIGDEAARIDRRIGALLARARPDDRPAGCFELLPVLREAVEVIRGDPGVQVAIAAPDPVGAVRGDADAMRGALLNLLDNAVEAGREAGRGRVEVRVRAEGRAVLVEILDEGPGLRTVDPEAPFRAFFTTKPTGTGLGLGIARAAVEAAGGGLELSTRADRSGAVARVRLSRAE